MQMKIDLFLAARLPPSSRPDCSRHRLAACPVLAELKASSVPYREELHGLLAIEVARRARIFENKAPSTDVQSPSIKPVTNRETPSTGRFAFASRWKHSTISPTVDLCIVCHVCHGGDCYKHLTLLPTQSAHL